MSPAPQTLPWQFSPEAYGAKRDGRLAADAAMTSGSATLTCATSAPFTPGDAGKYVLVWAADTATTYLFARITAYVSPSEVTLDTAAGHTVTASGLLWATDDTAAFQAAVDAAVAYAQANDSIAEIPLSEGIYGIASPAVPGDGISTFGNAAISLPYIDAATGPKVQLAITGTGIAQLPHWLQTQPSAAGSILAGMRTDGSLDNTFGPTSVIGGPVDGFGGGGGTFSNMCLTVGGVTVLVPASSHAYAGPDLYGLGQAVISGGFSYLPLAVVPSQSTWPSLADLGSSANYPAYSFGLRMPAGGNNAVADADAITTYWAQIGIVASEHFHCSSLRTLYSVYGMLPMSATGGTMSHGIRIDLWTCESVNLPLGSVGSGFFALNEPIGVSVGRLDLESYNHVVSDVAGKLYGEIGFSDQVAAGIFYSSTLFDAGSGAGVKLVHLECPQGIAASPPAVPATGVALVNGFYRDAMVNVQPNGATITKLTTDGTDLTTLVSGWVPVSSGHSITLAYSGGTPSWQWALT